MQDSEKIIKELESLRDICNARSDIFVGDVKIVWAGYGRTVSDAIALIEDQKLIYLALEHDWKMLRNMETQKKEVVHCKDCVFRRIEENDSTGTVRISCKHRWCAETKDDWFCADGKRAET